MVKYGKKLRKIKTKDWEDKYFNYKKLKQEIKKMVKEKESKNIENLNNIEKDEIFNNWIKEFTDSLDKEIRFIYIFFSKNEKRLYKDINIYLHIKDDYTTYDMQDYLQQYLELKKLSIFSFNISKYVYYNLKAIIKILKKFDKKVIGLQDKDFHIKKNFIVTKLEEQNSDILYLINFKMIDEVNVILEDLIACLKEQFKLNKNKFKKSIIEYSQDDKSENLLEEKKTLNFNQVNNLIEQIHKQIKLNIKNIDIVSSEITKLFLPWKEFLRISGDVSSRLIQLSKELNSFSEGNMEGGTSYRNNKSIVETITFSKQNSCNIILTLYHGLLYMFCLAIIIPFYPEFIISEHFWKNKNIQKDNKLYYGLFMMMAPLGSMIGYIYESNLFMKTTKIPFVLSSFGFILGNLFYFISIYFNPFFFVFLGRLLIGLFNLRTHNKMYIMNFLLKKDVSFYLTMFHTFSMIGLSLGFLLNIFFIDLSEEKKFINKYTFGSLLNIIFSIILSILSIKSFTEARSNNFNITAMKSFGAATKSFSTSINSNINENNANNININNVNDDHNVSNLIFDESLNEEYSEDLRNKTVMVNDINTQLGNFNRMSNYNDTNLVSLSISQLAFKEKEGLNSLFRSFILYLLIIFTTKFINESIFINLPILIKDYNDDNNDEIKAWILPFVFGFSCLLVLFIEFCLRHKNEFISEKTLLIILFFINLINDFILIFLKRKYSVFYFIIISLAIILSNIIEKYSTHFFYNIIPQDYKICKFQGNIFINVISMFSRIISSILIICFYKDYDDYEITIYLLFFILSLLCLLLFLMFYSDIRIKSISRIMNYLGKNEVKVATEV